MSRSRLERNPDRKCGYSWPDQDTTVTDCPHVCQLPIADHGDEHICCRLSDGRIPA